MSAGQLMEQEEVAVPLTVADEDAVLLEGCISLVVLVTLAVFVMTEPPAASPLTATTMVKMAVVLADSAAPVQVIVPVPPEVGVVHVKAGPDSFTSVTNVVPPGTSS